MTSEPGTPRPAPDLSGAVEQLESYLLGEPPHLTKVEVAEQVGVSVELADELWGLMGFPVQTTDAKAFTEWDVDALRRAHELIQLQILSPERQAALVRTWGRSFARLAEWQIELITQVALEVGAADVEAFTGFADEVVSRVESLQSYVWRRHLATAGTRALSVTSADTHATQLAVVFVDIVGYTAASKTMPEAELVSWLDGFENTVLAATIDRDARIIKNIGDELLLVAEAPVVALEIALELTARGEDDDDPFPRVRAGVAYGEVVSRLGDVFGETVNLAARLTAAAVPGSVLADRGVYTAVTGEHAEDPHGESADAPTEVHDETAYRFRRLRRFSVKDFPHVAAWRVRRRQPEP